MQDEDKYEVRNTRYEVGIKEEIGTAVNYYLSTVNFLYEYSPHHNPLDRWIALHFFRIGESQ